LILTKSLKHVLLVILTSASLFACNGSSETKSTSDTTKTTLPAPVIETMPAPIVAAADNQLLVFYNRPDNDYADWVLHVWNNETCNAYADFGIDEGTDWQIGQVKTGIDPNYGAYWLLDLSVEHSDCANVSTHV
jgi:pullulanase